MLPADPDDRNGWRPVLKPNVERFVGEQRRALYILRAAVRFLPKLVMPGDGRLTVTAAALGVTAAAALLTAVLCAVPTCIDVLSSDLSMLRGGSRSVSGNRTSARLRSMLIASEVALSIVFLIGAALMIRSLSHCWIYSGWDYRRILY